MKKEWKDKEVIIGLIIIIVLGAVALALLIRRDMKTASLQKEVQDVIVAEEETALTDESILQEEAAASEEAEVSPEVTEKTEEADAGEDSAEITASVQPITPGFTPDITTSKYKKTELYAILGAEKYQSCVMTEIKEDGGQMKELFGYWDSYQLDAVDDLVHLERIRKLSAQLNGTNKFYYYGSVDRLGRPNGKGLAMYGNNTYYCGEWKEGLRHGKGMWLQVAIYEEDSKSPNLGLIEHSYNGQWSKDLPNGDGQEHFSYNYDILSDDSMQDYGVIANVMGNFKNGYYDGEMYVMTADETGNTKDWGGVCEMGVWKAIISGNTTDAVWEAYEKNEDMTPVYHYMFPKDNQNWGVLGLKK